MSANELVDLLIPDQWVVRRQLDRVADAAPAGAAGDPLHREGRTRLDVAAKRGRDLWLSSKSKQGAGPGSPTHFPLFEGDRGVARVTEGQLKADLATQLSGVCTVGLPGVNAWKKAVKALRAVGAETVKVAYDADAASNRNIANRLQKLVGLLLKRGFTVELELWDAKDGKGIDDLFAAGKQPGVVTSEDAVLAAMAQSAPRRTPPTRRLEDPARGARTQKHRQGQRPRNDGVARKTCATSATGRSGSPGPARAGVSTTRARRTAARCSSVPGPTGAGASAR